MDIKMKKLLGSLLLMMGCISMQASAHLIYFAYDDLGDGTVDFYAQHYHSVTEGTGSGFKFTNDSDPTDTYLSIWDDTVAAKSIDDFSGFFTQGWDLAIGNATYTDTYAGYWLVARGVSLANGTYNVATVSPTAVDTPWTALPQVTITGVTSVPEPSTLAIFALGMMGLASRRFKKKS
jgi:hypothetical protein